MVQAPTFAAAAVAAIILGAAPALAELEDAPSPSDPAERAELLDYGAYLANDCVSCHRIEPGGRRASNLTGLDEDEIYKKITSFRTEKQDGAILNWVIDELSPRDVRALALYFSSLPKAE